ncbi:MAG: GxxExxY protein [Prosthecobacter sp.]
MNPIKHPDLGKDLSGRVIGAAIEVHRKFGPGLDEADYERALSLELHALGIAHECQVPLPLRYKGNQLECGYRMDLVLPGRLLLELKALDKLHPLHEAQLLTYLHLSNLPLGLLINFGELLIKDSIVRRANTCATREPMEPFQASHSTMDEISRLVVEAAVEVQAHLGAGLLRSAYQVCLHHELVLRGLKVECDQPGNLVHRDQLILSGKQVPMVVEDSLMIACYCSEKMDRLHLARARSLLRASTVESGLCINFHTANLAGQLKRISIRK